MLCNKDLKNNQMQLGFIIGREIIAEVFTFKILQCMVLKKKKSYICFIDLNKTFDGVATEMRQKMEKSTTQLEMQ